MKRQHHSDSYSDSDAEYQPYQPRKKYKTSKTVRSDDDWNSQEYNPSQEEDSDGSESNSDPILPHDLKRAVEIYEHRAAQTKQVTQELVDDGHTLYANVLSYKTLSSRVRLLVRELQKKLDEQYIDCDVCNKSVKSKGFKEHCLSDTHLTNIEYQEGNKRVDDPNDHSIWGELWSKFSTQTGDVVCCNDLTEGDASDQDQNGDFDGDSEALHEDEFFYSDDSSCSQDENGDFDADTSILHYSAPDFPHVDANVSTLLLCDFFKKNHGKPFSESMFQWFLDFITNPKTVKNVPPTVYLLKKAGAAFAPQIVCSRLFE